MVAATQGRPAQGSTGADAQAGKPSSRFELLLFRLGGDPADESGRSELFGINIFKVREIVAMPKVTAVVGAHPHVLGVVDLRGQIMQVIDLPAVVGVTPRTGLNIMLVTEFARTTQAFAVEGVEEIVQLDWQQVLAAEGSASGGLVTSIARLDKDVNSARLAQVLDVEAIVRTVSPPPAEPPLIGAQLRLRPGAVVLAADDSAVARSLLEQEFEALDTPHVIVNSGREAWEQLLAWDEAARREGKTIQDKVALVLTDLEMPEMDGFTLTRNIKHDPRFATLPVVIHSSLSGETNEAQGRSAGADAYVAKFSATELAEALRAALSRAFNP
ncbi:chemotaxis protein [Xylophilus sp.]|uniref:chemotaxis protein n=1 Tax=Xylophilus sp. TaxID=2653893 RepID=UPI0013B6EED5|nr:chemotaxis protein [Xylophilus sp.]KAF1047805.1 MAG: Chemotaxis protein CheV [Xylophilus sp.]